MREIGAGLDHHPDEPATAPAERPPAIGGDERRMHVRAYNFWMSLLAGRAYPSIEDLHPREIADFGPHSVLLDFTGGVGNPAIAYLGDALRRECAPDREIRSIADVPGRSLLSRLTDHYLQIIANRAPIGFEAEFVNTRGLNTLYRGILMPFSSDDDRIDFLYGVINWKEMPASAPLLAAAAEAAGAPSPLRDTADGTAWADGPGHDLAALADAAEEGVEALPPGHNATLADHLAAAREQAGIARGVRLRSRAALYRALGLAYDFALLALARPDEYAELLDESGVRAQPRAPMTAVVKLIFGADVDKARATEFAATLAHAQRIGLGPGALAGHVEALPGGLKAMVAAERKARRPASAPPGHAEIARAALRKVAPQMVIDLPADGKEFVLLLARREEGGRLAVIAPVPDEPSLVDRAIRRVTR